ncbi:MAG: hypothetical protein ACLRWM_07255 [Streptococcus sp.]
MDESALTGESLPVEKSLDEVPEGAALGDQTTRIFRKLRDLWASIF